MLDQSIKMLCDTHKAPAVFYSNKEDRYVCFKCIVSSEKLLYIDKSYKHEMEDFERIKDLTAEAARSNIKNLDIIKKWKQEIRGCLMRVRERFNENVDKFIYTFGQLFKDVEMSNDLKDFRGEDKRLQILTEDLQKKYCEILKIFANISNSTAEKRIKYIDNIKLYMKNLEKKV